MIVNANARISIAVKAIKNNENTGINLETIVVPLAFRDLIEIELIDNRFLNLVHYANRSIHIGEKEIIDVALFHMQAHYEYNQSFHIKIHKNIPTGYGLGSGASNAAAIMKAIARLLKLKTTEEELLSVAKKIGRDVPYFFNNKVAHYNLATHETKVITKKLKAYVLLLLPPNIIDKEMIIHKTADDFQNSESEISDLFPSIKAQNLKQLGKSLFNDLAKAVITTYPLLQVPLEHLQSEKIEACGISGAGSTIFAFSANKHTLNRFALKYSKIGYRTIITNVIN